MYLIMNPSASGMKPGSIHNLNLSCKLQNNNLSCKTTTYPAKQQPVLQNNNLSCKTTTCPAKQQPVLQNNLSCKTTTYPAKQRTWCIRRISQTTKNPQALYLFDHAPPLSVLSLPNLFPSHMHLFMNLFIKSSLGYHQEETPHHREKVA